MFDIKYGRELSKTYIKELHIIRMSHFYAEPEKGAKCKNG